MSRSATNHLPGIFWQQWRDFLYGFRNQTLVPSNVPRPAALDAFWRGFDSVFAPRPILPVVDVPAHPVPGRAPPNRETLPINPPAGVIHVDPLENPSVTLAADLPPSPSPLVSPSESLYIANPRLEAGAQLANPVIVAASNGPWGFNYSAQSGPLVQSFNAGFAPNTGLHFPVGANPYG